MSDYSSMTGSSSSGSQTAISAFFDNRADAEDAIERLRGLGIADADIRLTEGAEGGTRTEDESKGFWASLGDLFFPDEDRAVYAEGLSRGGYLVVVSGLSADSYELALDILDDEGAVDIEERSASWREEGWTGTYGSQGVDYEGGAAAGAVSDYQGSAAGYGGTGSGSVEGGAGTGMIGGAAGLSGGQRSGEGAWDETSGQSRSLDEDEVVPVVEERLRVGKRDTSHGRVRVRSYVVEEPVSETVHLRDERVEVERRAVDRPVTGGGDPFRERSIEAQEHREEAVVSKEARVVGEVGLRKTSEARDETVSDTVRRTEVELEDERTAGRDASGRKDLDDDDLTRR
jgi:stress response protein YsnF